jgi:hypothetical protein
MCNNRRALFDNGHFHHQLYRHFHQCFFDMNVSLGTDDEMNRSQLMMKASI